MVAGWLNALLNLLGMGGGGSAPIPGGSAPVFASVRLEPSVSATPRAQPAVTATARLIPM